MPSDRQKSNASFLPKRKIALVDDESGITDLYSELFEDQFDVITFNDPTAFITYLSQNTGKEAPFDVLMTDLKMPQMTGAQMIEKAYSLGFDFPSIILSGYLDKENLLQALNAGVHRVLEKPATAKLVSTTINELVAEQEVYLVRKEIRHLMKMMREYYSYMRIFISNHVPEEELNNFAFDATTGKNQVGKNISLDEMIDSLEERFDQMIKAEKSLETLIKARHKNGDAKTTSC